MRRMIALAMAAGIVGVVGCDFSQRKNPQAEVTPKTESKVEKPAVAETAQANQSHVSARVVELEFSAGEKKEFDYRTQSAMMRLLIDQLTNQKIWTDKANKQLRWNTLAAIYSIRQGWDEMGEAARDLLNFEELRKVYISVGEEKPDTTIEAAMQIEMLRAGPRSMFGGQDVKMNPTPLIKAIQQDGGLAPDVAANGKAKSELMESALGTLGLMAAADWGSEIPIDAAKLMDGYLRKAQRPDGSWHDARLTDEVATALALAALTEVAELKNTGARLEATPDKNIEAAWRWIDAKALPWKTKSPRDAMAVYYLQRAAMAVGRDPINSSEVFEINFKAMQLLNKQPNATPNAKTEIIAYGLLTLEAGKATPAFQKLDYGSAANARPQDVKYLTQWVGKLFQQNMRWRSINFETPDWEQSPVLIITGSKAISLSDEQVARLRTYIERGGLIFSTADGASKEFSDSIKALAVRVTGGKYEVKELSHDHMLYSKKNELWKAISQPITLQSINNDVRESWVHSPMDLGVTWQTRRISSESFLLMANINRYAVGKQTAVPLWIKRNEVTLLEPTKWLTIGRVTYRGNYDPEPAAWKRMAIEARRKGIGLKLADVAIKNLRADEIPLAHLSVTERFPLSDENVESLMRYVGDGGVLLLDAPGGSEKSAEFVSELAERIFPKMTWHTAAQFEPRDYRNYTRLKVKPLPGLDELHSDGKVRAVILEADLTAAMVGISAWGINGLKPEPARDAMMTIINKMAK